jgi:hypothetical protein
MIQGANMVLTRRAFDALGGFDDDLGPGGVLNGCDVEMVGRASALGYTGVLLPDLRVRHHHGRRRASPEAQAIVDGYAAARGGYYAGLMLLGETQAWALWRRAVGQPPKSPARLRELALEFEGAAAYLRLRERKPLRPGKPAGD